MKLSEQTQIEAQIGFTSGILVGVLASAGFLLFFMKWEWYWKVLTGIGEIGIIGNLIITLRSLIKMRKGLIDAQEMFKDMKGGENETKRI